MTERRGFPCSLPFCQRSVYRAEDEFVLCPGHMMHVSARTFARWESGEWTVDLQGAVIVEALTGGLMHLAGSGDEARARLRATMRRKREAMAA